MAPPTVATLSFSFLQRDDESAEDATGAAVVGSDAAEDDEAVGADVELETGRVTAAIGI